MRKLKIHMNILKKSIDGIERLFFGVSMLVTVLMMVLITSDAIGRSLLNQPILGVYEITQDFLMIALVFLSLSFVYVKGAHIRVTMFVQMLPARLKALLGVLSAIASLCFALLLTAGGWQLFMRALELGTYSMGSLQYSLAPSFLLVLLGSALLCIRAIHSIFHPIADDMSME